MANNRGRNEAPISGLTSDAPAVAEEVAVATEDPRDGKTLKEIHTEERKFYLGRTDTIPFSGGKTIAEGKKEYREREAKFEAEKLERREAKIATRKPTETDPFTSPAGEATGTLPATEVDHSTDDKPALPTFQELTEMDHPTVLAQAVTEGLEDPELADLPNTDIVDLILSKRTA